MVGERGRGAFQVWSKAGEDMFPVALLGLLVWYGKRVVQAEDVICLERRWEAAVHDVPIGTEGLSWNAICAKCHFDKSYTDGQ
jgi:hypothetical protein